MEHYEYTDEEKTFIQNTLKKHKKLIEKLLKMEDDLLGQNVRTFYDNEHTHICEEIHCQAWGIKQETGYLEQCLEDQSIPLFEYDDKFQRDKEMIQQIRKLIKHFNSKPQVDYIYG